jgi:hypothetical protein
MYILYCGTPKRNSRKKISVKHPRTPLPKRKLHKADRLGTILGEDSTKDLSSTVIGDPWNVSRYLPAKMMDVGI